MEILVETKAKHPSPAVFILLGDHDEKEVLCELLAPYKEQAVFVFVMSFDWNKDLSPWPSRAVFSGAEDFSGGADAFLDELLKKALPFVTESTGFACTWCALAGYSLAGLFSVYALYRTDVFTRVASVSGSLWYAGFSEYGRTHPFAGTPKKIYFSYGSREKRTKNSRMAKVEEATKELYEHCQKEQVACILEINPGNHFQNAPQRLAKGIIALLD